MTEVMTSVYELMGKVSEGCREENQIKEKVENMFKVRDDGGREKKQQLAALSEKKPTEMRKAKLISDGEMKVDEEKKTIFLFFALPSYSLQLLVVFTEYYVSSLFTST